MLTTIQKPISVTVHSLNGKPITTDSRNFPSDFKGLSKSENPFDFKNPFKYQGAYLMDYYYAKQLNRLPFQGGDSKNFSTPPTEVHTSNLIGMGPFIALTETISAGCLVKAIPSISTVINLVTTLGEFFKTWVAGTDSLGNPNDENKKKAEEAKERREGLMAWVQIFAGSGGALGFLWDLFFGKEHDMKEVPLWEKISLSVASAFNTIFMFFGAAEKTLISSLSRNDENNDLSGNEHVDMKINGHNDRRCAVEWGVMTALPWLSNIGLVKNIIDLGIIYGALREGVDHFLGENKIYKLCNNLDNKPLLKRCFKYFANPLLLFTKKDPEEKLDLICFPFSKGIKWFLGTESDENGPGTGGFRQKYLVPVLRFFGTNPPLCYLDKSGNVISEFYHGTAPKVVEKELKPASITLPKGNFREQKMLPRMEKAIS